MVTILYIGNLNLNLVTMDYFYIMVQGKLHVILMIEDNFNIRENLCECLSLDGYTNIL